MSKKELTPEQREAKRARDRKYRAKKRAEAIAAKKPVKKAEKAPIAQKAAKKPAKASVVKHTSSTKKCAPKAQKAGNRASCACKQCKTNKGVIQATFSIELTGPGVETVTEQQREALNTLLEAARHIASEILQG